MPNPIYLNIEGPFLCTMCGHEFTDPVDKPCGHNFCNACISAHWTIPYQCPVCKTIFNKPEPGVQTFSAEMSAQAALTPQHKVRNSEQQVCKPGDVPCDVCTGTKLKAQKSCLVCLASFCETHLEPHLTSPPLKKHQLIKPVKNLQDRTCEEHSKPLELFCKKDQTCICAICTVSNHKFHDCLQLKEAYEGKKAELEKKEDEIQDMIQKRRMKIQEMKRSVELSNQNAEGEIAQGVQVFTALIEEVRRRLNMLTDSIREKQRKTEKQAEGLIKQLEQEISELEKRSSEVKQLSSSEDHLHLLQSFKSLQATPPTKNWTEVKVQQPSYEGTVERAVKQLEETLSKQINEAKLWMVQKYAVEVTLDPDTANPWLILSPDGKQISYSDREKILLDSPKRFDSCPCVLAKQSFSSGRFYYEVQVEGKTAWDLGVARESINRKGQIILRPQDGYWTICLRNGNFYQACADPAVHLSLRSQPEKVGVFVDYEEGLVSFYDVDAAALIYSFTGCSFNEKIFPYFSPDNIYGAENSAPLIISPAEQSKNLISFRKNDFQSFGPPNSASQACLTAHEKLVRGTIQSYLYKIAEKIY